MHTMTGDEIAGARLVDWSLLHDALHTRLLTKEFSVGLRLVQDIGAAAESANHHPDLDLRFGHLDIRLTSHDAGGVTRRDLVLAAAISKIAAVSGVRAAPGSAQVLEVALDTPDLEAVLPFWRTVLDMAEVRSADAGPELRHATLPALWFQQSGREIDRQRFHFDLWISPDVVEQRIAAALAAGGTLISAKEAPAFWVLADSQDNRVCLCTWQAREE